jgi:hypothetical protein
MYSAERKLVMMYYVSKTETTHVCGDGVLLIFDVIIFSSISIDTNDEIIRHTMQQLTTPP